MWAQLAGGIAEIENLADALGERAAMDAVGVQLFAPVAEKLGWDPAQVSMRVGWILEAADCRGAMPVMVESGCRWEASVEPCPRSG